MTKVPTARILVIDDNPEVVDVLATCLREEGYEVLGAPTGHEGLKDFILSRPDLILLDIALPGGMDGIELLKRIHSINPTSLARSRTSTSRSILPTSSGLSPWRSSHTILGPRRRVCPEGCGGFQIVDRPEFKIVRLHERPASL